MAKRKARPCPRELYNRCPIPRERCTEDHERTGTWHCLTFLREFEWFLFDTPEEAADEPDAAVGEVITLEDLMRVLEGEAGTE